MENHPSKRSAFMADWPKIVRKKRTLEEEVQRMESLTIESSLDCAIYDECDSSGSNEWPKKRIRRPLPKPPILKLYPMPDELRRKIRGMGGNNIILVMQKQLSYTDLTHDNSRLSIPKGQIIFDFLYKDEEARLNEYVENSKRKIGIEVLVIDPRLEEMEMGLKKWKMDKACVYNLTHNWNYLIEKNRLHAGDTIQLWSFRMEQRRITKGSGLCFALLKLKEEEGVDNGKDNTQSTSGDLSHC